jgi:hypothetical protein
MFNPKKYLTLFFLFTVLAPASMLWGQNTYVPDDNFEQALIDLGYDDTWMIMCSRQTSVVLHGWM